MNDVPSWDGLIQTKTIFYVIGRMGRKSVHMHQEMFVLMHTNLS